MRLIGELENSTHAQKFSDYLTREGILNQVSEEAKGNERIYEIWIQSEDQLKQAEEMLAIFRQNPDSEEYEGVSKEARKIKKQMEKEAKSGPAYMDARTTIFYRGPARRGALTLVLIVISVGISVLSKLGSDTNSLRMLFITDSFSSGLAEIMNGEVWRLFTPMFIHFGPIHLLFNMMWLYDLGNMVEDRKSTLFLAIFILVIAGSSNWAQYLASGPSFGGMSGVVYGLLGYIWMKGKYDPASRLGLHKTTVVWMIGWYFLCLTGFVGHIANMAHTVGLGLGIAWGYLTSPKFKQLFLEKR